MKATLILLTFVVSFICTSWNSPVSSSAASGEKTKITKTVPVPDFAFFRLHKHGRNGAGFAWGLGNSNGVSGFVVQRTYEDPFDPYSEWAHVSSVPCNGNGQHRYTDTPLTPGFISYRILAVDNGGVPLCVSGIETIRIVQH